MTDWQEFIWTDPERRGGRPCIKGTRIAVHDVLGWLAAGETIDEIIEMYTTPTREGILACLAYARDVIGEIKDVSSI